MPSGWMPDARHDTRTAFLFVTGSERPEPPVRATRRTPAPRTHVRRTAHRTSRHPHAIARG